MKENLDRMIKAHQSRRKRYGIGEKLFLNELCFVGTSVSHKDISNAGIIGCDFHESVFADTDFSYSNLGGSQFESCEFTRCDFIKAELYSTLFRGTKMRDCSMFRAICIGTNWSNAEVNRAKFSRMLFKDSSFEGATFQSVDFTNTQFVSVNVSNTRFVDCIFDDVRIVKMQNMSKIDNESSIHVNGVLKRGEEVRAYFAHSNTLVWLKRP